MLTDEQKARLNPEQLAVAEKWERERDERSIIINNLDEAQKAGDNRRFRELIAEMDDIGSDFCEHDRSIWSSCGACDEIERLLNPELYCQVCEQSCYDERGLPEVPSEGICRECRKE